MIDKPKEPRRPGKLILISQLRQNLRELICAIDLLIKRGGENFDEAEVTELRELQDRAKELNTDRQADLFREEPRKEISRLADKTTAELEKVRQLATKHGIDIITPEEPAPRTTAETLQIRLLVTQMEMLKTEIAQLKGKVLALTARTDLDKGITSELLERLNILGELEKHIAAMTGSIQSGIVGLIAGETMFTRNRALLLRLEAEIQSLTEPSN